MHASWVVSLNPARWWDILTKSPSTNKYRNLWIPLQIDVSFNTNSIQWVEAESPVLRPQSHNQMKFLSHNLSHSHEEHKQFCSQANKKDIWLDELKPASNYQQVDILIKFIKKMREREKNFNLMMRSSFALFCCICLSGSLFGFYFHIHDDIQTIWTNFLLWNSITRMRQKSFCSNGWDTLIW